MLQLSPRSTIALVGSSDGLPRDSDTVSRLCAVLESLGLHTVIFHPYTRLLPASRSRQTTRRRHTSRVCRPGSGCFIRSDRR